MRGWTKDEQRAVFQPVILTGMMMIAISLSVAGAITIDTLKLYALGLPALLAGLWLGFRCYGKLDDAKFRKLVLVLLLCSGLALIGVTADRAVVDSPARLPKAANHGFLEFGLITQKFTARRAAQCLEEAGSSPTRFHLMKIGKKSIRAS